MNFVVVDPDGTVVKEFTSKVEAEHFARQRRGFKPPHMAPTVRRSKPMKTLPIGKGFPGVDVTLVRPEFIDEWYGVAVHFDWERPLDLEGYRVIIRNEDTAWSKANPRGGYKGLLPTERKIKEHIVDAILASPEWSTFFSNPEVRAKIGRLGREDFDHWDFDEDGGMATAMRR